MENFLKVWRTSDLIIEGKIVIFKSLATSKIVHLALIKTVTIFTVGELIIIEKLYLARKKTK